MTITKGGQPIQCLDDWGKRAGPKSTKHWVADRSAMEAARSWLAVTSPDLPPEVAAVLAGHSAFGVVERWEAEPEARLAFDEFPGEPRNADLAVYARDQYGDFVIAVEAKADEPFGETVADTLASAVDRKLETHDSNGVTRVEQLAAALLGPRAHKDPALKKLRYQLLTATAGALRAGDARSVRRVVVLVHEFMTRLTKDHKHKTNTRDLERFVSRLSHRAVTIVDTGVLYGPFTIPGAPLFKHAAPLLYIGKATCNLRQQQRLNNATAVSN